MKKCPNCHELVGDTADNCFNCQYSFVLGKLPNQSERENIIKDQTAKTEHEQNFQVYLQQKRYADAQVRSKLQEEIQNIQNNRNDNLLKNPYYEYQAVQLRDTQNGYLPQNKLQSVLDQFSQEGWKLHTMSTNVVSTSSVGIAANHVGAAKSASMEITTLIFERCIRPAEY